ncbi:ABC transporter ATP-binding protein [Ferrovibrio sp.]|uniref:ABC transporter ATP-binding protein n=1 Tax=Ferrovibrio sp. TaxID=1917215 RepID=UPI0035B093C6
MSNAMPPLLEARNISKAFGRFVAVAGVDLVIRKGERRALIGPNGAGKSTLLSILGGQQAGGAGAGVLLDGEDVSGLQPQDLARRGVGRTFQISRTFRKMTVAENMLASLLPQAGQIYSLSTRRLNIMRDQADAILAEVGLSRRSEMVVDEISHGDRKRLEFGMVLATRPRLLLLDEPAAGMGLQERQELMAMMLDQVTRNGITLVFVEHDIDIVFRIADVITVMARGRIFAEGSPQEIASNRDVQDIYLGSGH